ncbi:hypothetical protein BaRGS_00029785 [Batillaria attramentaria]|uniref:G-protein coupled receptors family 1 profile domain-containing protein n=1 Tax=Batillaria attramentaria TaxID=370345 RepID=A0ABD0JWC7_9CAEN
MSVTASTILPDVINTSSPMDANSSSSELGHPAAPAGCLLLLTQDFVPWDNPHNLIGMEFARLVSRAKACYILPVLFLVGFPTNCINMAVFYRQGLKERVSLCLFALSFADLVYGFISTLLYGDQFIAQFTGAQVRFGPLFTFIIRHRLNVLYGFAWASMFMSAVIASDRCFCILYPFRSKSFLSARATAAIIVTAFVVILGGYVIVLFRYDTICVYNPITNATTIEVSQTSEFYRENKELVNQMDNVVYGVVTVGIFISVVTVATTITAVKLRQVATWREGTSSCTTSAREVALTRMLVSASVLFVVCYSPKFLFGFVCVFIPEMNAGRKFHNTFLMCTSLIEIMSAINSSVNFFIYYRLGSRYREVFWEMFRREKKSANSLIKSNMDTTNSAVD